MIEGMNKIPPENNFGIIRFEDLISKDINVFLERIEISAKEKVYMPKLNKTKSKFIIPKWVDWDDAQKNDAEIWMGKELQLFGYSWE